MLRNKRCAVTQGQMWRWKHSFVLPFPNCVRLNQKTSEKGVCSNLELRFFYVKAKVIAVPVKGSCPDPNFYFVFPICLIHTMTEYSLNKWCAMIVDYKTKSEVKVKTKYFIFILMPFVKASPCEMVIIQLWFSAFCTALLQPNWYISMPIYL